MKDVPAAFLFPITGSEPIYRQLYEAFRTAIHDGRLRPGQRVPSTRALAAELQVSRIPVVGAYEQLLAEGYFETSAGAGTRVSRSIPPEGVGAAPVPDADPLPLVAPTQGPRQVSRRGASLEHSTPQPWLRPTGAFRLGRPALDEFPDRTWAKLVARHCRKPVLDIMAHGDALGYLPFREVVAEYLGAVRGVRCAASQVLVTNGSQEALQIAAQVLLDPTDSVCVEEPGFPGARQAFLSAGARIQPVGVDAEGIRVEDLVRTGPTARAVYVTPSHQYPTGATLSTARRLSLLGWAAQVGAWVIEDDYDSEYRLGSRPVPALQGLDGDERVIYVGTFSEVLYPALRLGYLVAPKDLVPALAAARRAADAFPPPFYQAVLTDFIREGYFGRHIRRMRLLYSERHEALRTAVQSHLGDVLELVGAEAGMHLVGLLQSGTDDVAVATRAAQHGVSVTPLSRCYLLPPRKHGLLLGYGGANPAQLREGILRLKAVLGNPSSLSGSRAAERSAASAEIPA